MHRRKKKNVCSVNTSFEGTLTLLWLGNEFSPFLLSCLALPPIQLLAWFTKATTTKKPILIIHHLVHPKENCGDVINGLVNQSFTLEKESSSRLWEKNAQSERTGSGVKASFSYCWELDTKFQNPDIDMFPKVHKLASNKLISFHYTEKGWVGDWEGGAEKVKL